MFKSGLLDKFTRVHHLVPVVIFLPAIVDARRASASTASACWPALGYAIGGYALWTLAEYWIHRVIFHFEPEEGIGARAALDGPRRPPRSSRTTRCGS